MRWLQLSDLHLYFKNYQTRVLRDAMLDYLTKVFGTESSRVNYLFITGDLSHQGETFSSDISDFLDKIMEILNIGKESIFIIPGNHDIKRTNVTRRLITSIINSENPLNEINSLDEETKVACEETLTDYYNFYDDFFGLVNSDKRNHFVEERDNYNIIHINTAVYSGTDNIEGNLLINLVELLDVLQKVDQTKTSIALGHHPVESFHPDIQNTFINRLSDYNIDLYLCGHVHNSKYFKEGNNYNDIHFFTSGSIIDENYGDITFLSGSINEYSGDSLVSFHTWNQEHEYWTKNVNLGRLAPNGDYKFRLNRQFEQTEVENASEETDKSINTNEFQKFLIDFYKVVSENNEYSNLEFKDVTKKFVDMKCEFTQRKYDIHSQAFSVVNHVVSSNIYGGLERRMLVPFEVINAYETVYYKYKSGDLIYNEMVDYIYNKYVDDFEFDNNSLRLYIAVLISWSIYECDIFNQVQSE